MSTESEGMITILDCKPDIHQIVPIDPSEIESMYDYQDTVTAGSTLVVMKDHRCIVAREHLFEILRRIGESGDTCSISVNPADH